VVAQQYHPPRPMRRDRDGGLSVGRAAAGAGGGARGVRCQSARPPPAVGAPAHEACCRPVGCLSRAPLHVPARGRLWPVPGVSTRQGRHRPRGARALRSCPCQGLPCLRGRVGAGHARSAAGIPPAPAIRARHEPCPRAGGVGQAQAGWVRRHETRCPTDYAGPVRRRCCPRATQRLRSAPCPLCSAGWACQRVRQVTWVAVGCGVSPCRSVVTLPRRGAHRERAWRPCAGPGRQTRRHSEGGALYAYGP